MKATLKGKTLIIEIDLDADPKDSASGKSKTRASTRGNVTTDQMIDGKPLIVSINAYTSNK